MVPSGAWDKTIKEMEKLRQLEAKGLNNNVDLAECNKQNALVKTNDKRRQRKHIIDQCIEDSFKVLPIYLKTRIIELKI